MHAPVTPSHVRRIVALFLDGHSLAYIADATGLDLETVFEFVEQSELDTASTFRPWPDEARELAVTLRLSGYSCEQVAKVLGRSEQAISHICHQSGRFRRPVLTEDQERELVRMYNEGMTLKDAAAAMGITPYHATAVIHYRRRGERKPKVEWWTDEEIEVLRERGPVEASKVLDRSEDACRIKMKELQVQETTNDDRTPQRKRWTDEDKTKARTLRAQGRTMAQIAAELGRSVSAISSFFGRDPEVRRRPRRPWTKEEIRQVEDMVRRGIRVSKIARTFDRNVGSVYSIIRRQGIEPAVNHKYTWTDEDVGRFVELWKAGLTAKQIASKIGKSVAACYTMAHRLRAQGRLAPRSYKGRKRGTTGDDGSAQ